MKPNYRRCPPGKSWRRMANNNSCCRSTCKFYLHFPAILTPPNFFPGVYWFLLETCYSNSWCSTNFIDLNCEFHSYVYLVCANIFKNRFEKCIIVSPCIPGNSEVSTRSQRKITCLLLSTSMPFPGKDMRKHPHFRPHHLAIIPSATPRIRERKSRRDTSPSGAEWRINTTQLVRTASVGGPCCSRFPFPSRCVRR